MCGFTAILGFNSDGNEVKFRLMIKRGKHLVGEALLLNCNLFFDVLVMRAHQILKVIVVL